MKILIIEDNHRIANNISRGLKINDENSVIQISESGEDAIIVIPEFSPDIIILDWMLPKMSGIDVLKNIRNRDIHIPVLMLSAKSTIENKIEGLEVGADDYLTKPFNMQELIARISALGRRPKQILDNILTSRNLTLNTKTKEVHRGKRTIHLAPKEFELLLYLLQHKGIILSADKILQNVWDFAHDLSRENNSNKVSVYIRYLRNKIDTPFIKSKSILETVRGVGYRILDI